MPAAGPDSGFLIACFVGVASAVVAMISLGGLAIARSDVEAAESTGWVALTCVSCAASVISTVAASAALVPA